MKQWFDCVKQPSETGKKVLCQRHGDLYVAIRMGKYYVPMPFAEHHFCLHLCYPETWSEIDFPEGLTGHTRVFLPGETPQPITFSEAEVDYPDLFKQLYEGMIKSIGTLKRK